MSQPVPAIYAPTTPTPKLSALARLAALVVCLGSAAVLIVGWQVQPNVDGAGTHTSLGFARCQFMDRTGIPCPSCGMTTSVSHFAHGNLAASVYVQPMGAVIAALTAAAFWVSLYLAITGKPALRPLRLVPMPYYLVPLVAMGVAAWGWKIFIHVRGLDGWR